MVNEEGALGDPVLIGERYELDDHATARGNMGEVRFGRDTKLDRPVAVKFLTVTDDAQRDDLIRRFRRESRITARLEHPGVPAVYDSGTHQGRPYLVMQRVTGRTIASIITEAGRLPVARACSIAAQVCAVLSAAHRASLVHRDLKPANLVLCPDGTVKVLDFGLAVALELDDFSRITHPGDRLGTPAYMAPEQAGAGRRLAPARPRRPRTVESSLCKRATSDLTWRPSPVECELAWSTERACRDS